MPREYHKDQPLPSLPVDSTQSRAALVTLREDLDAISSHCSISNGVCDRYFEDFKAFRRPACKTDEEAQLDAEVDTAVAIGLYRTCYREFTGSANAWENIVSACARHYTKGGAEMWYLCHARLVRHRARWPAKTA